MAFYKFSILYKATKMAETRIIAEIKGKNIAGMCNKVLLSLIKTILSVNSSFPVSEKFSFELPQLQGLAILSDRAKLFIQVSC